jgi:hypothetical protein
LLEERRQGTWANLTAPNQQNVYGAGRVQLRTRMLHYRRRKTTKIAIESASSEVQDLEATTRAYASKRIRPVMSAAPDRALDEGSYRSFGPKEGGRKISNSRRWGCSATAGPRGLWA